jgi:Mn2+/Fe2+ NRAMP family transporter
MCLPGFGAETKEVSMLAPFATLAFLLILWLAAIVVAEVLGQSGGKVLAALKGRSKLANEPLVYARVVRITPRSRTPRVLRAQPQLSDLYRAAA